MVQSGDERLKSDNEFGKALSQTRVFMMACAELFQSPELDNSTYLLYGNSIKFMGLEEVVKFDSKKAYNRVNNHSNLFILSLLLFIESQS